MTSRPEDLRRTLIGEKDRSPDLTIVQWNVLADCYVYEDEYPAVPRAALDWGCRRQRLLAALEALEADLLCLQEVEQDHYRRPPAPRHPGRRIMGRKAAPKR